MYNTGSLPSMCSAHCAAVAFAPFVTGIINCGFKIARRLLFTSVKCDISEYSTQ